MIREKEKYISSGLILLDYLSIIVGYLVLAYSSAWMAAIPGSDASSCDPNNGIWFPTR
jgi:hypothetical protein